MQRVQRTTLATALLAGCAIAGAANAQVIRITNVNGSTGHDIPLKTNSSVQIDSAGNLLAECALNASGVCTALSTGGTSNPNAPTATLSRVDNNAEVTVGEDIRLAWNSSNADVCKVSSSPSAGFSGPRIAADSGGEVVTLGAVGTYTFSLVCYNSGGASTAATVSVVVGEGTVVTPPPAQGNCPSDLQVNPSNFSKSTKTWTQVFSSPDGSPQATYPNNAGFPTPVGATKGTYVVVPFVPLPNQSVNLYWDQVQPRPQDGYTQSRPATNMFFAISPCSGDLRSWSNTAPDKFLREGCRKMGNGASLIWSSGPLISQTTTEACKLDAGTQYFLHIAPIDPSDGLQTGEHTCENVPNSANGCDVAVNISTGPG